MPACARCGEPNGVEAAFCGRCGARLIPDPAPASARKVVTVVFSDVSGFTALGERLDPESLQQLMLESARELLWFGIGEPPEWADDAPTPHALTRLYRVTTHGEPALLISESFAVERRAGAFRLAWLTDATS